MKKLIFAFMAITAITFAACGNKATTNGTENDTVVVDTVDSVQADTVQADTVEI